MKMDLLFKLLNVEALIIIFIFQNIRSFLQFHFETEQNFLHKNQNKWKIQNNNYLHYNDSNYIYDML